MLLNPQTPRSDSQVTSPHNFNALIIKQTGNKNRQMYKLEDVVLMFKE